jgi:hypothetical protein
MKRNYATIKETLKFIEVNYKAYSEYRAKISLINTQCAREDFNSIMELKNNEYSDSLKRVDMTYKYVPTTSLIQTFLDVNKDELIRELIKEDYFNNIKPFTNKIASFVGNLEMKQADLPKIDEIKKRWIPANVEITALQGDSKFEIKVKNSFIVTLEFSASYTCYYKLTVSGLNDYVVHYNPQFKKEFKLPSIFKRKLKEIDRSGYKVIRRLNDFFVERFALQSPKASKLSPHIALHSFVVSVLVNIALVEGL